MIIVTYCITHTYSVLMGKILHLIDREYTGICMVKDDTDLIFRNIYTRHLYCYMVCIYIVIFVSCFVKIKIFPECWATQQVTPIDSLIN